MTTMWLGGTGIGFVWGWLIVQFGDRAYYPSSKNSGVWLGSILLSIFTYFSADWSALLSFLAAAATSLTIHAMWLRSLRSRFGAPDPAGGVR